MVTTVAWRQEVISRETWARDPDGAGPVGEEGSRVPRHFCPRSHSPGRPDNWIHRVPDVWLILQMGKLRPGEVQVLA